MPALQRQSIRTRLALVICGLLLALGVVSSIAAYVAVRHSALGAARQRLTAVTEQLRQMFETSFGRAKLQVDSGAALPALRAYLASAGTRDAAPARATLDSLGGGGRSVLDAELWDTAGRVMLASRADVPPVPAAAVREMAETHPAERATFVTPFRIEGDSVDFAVVAPVRRGGTTLGYLALRSRLRGTPQAVRQLRGLIGSKAVVLLGNARGDLWTDLAQRAAGPPASVADNTAGLLEYQHADGTWRLAASAVLAAAPWTIVVEFPRGPVLAGARAVAVEIAAITLGLVLLGWLAAWFVSRPLTQPLHQLADAAEAIAGGDYGQRVEVPRDDETGTVATAFNRMAATVQQAHERLETQVNERTADLTQTVRELEAFSYSVSHDLRAPLRSIDGFSLALLEDYDAQLNDTGRDYLRRVRRATQRMAELIDDLLALSRITRTELQHAPVDLSALAEEIVAELRKAEPERRVEAVIAPDLTVHGDRRLLRQALQNLLANAFKFTAKEPDPTVRLDVTSDGAERVFFVRDNGVGFDMQYAGKLFGPFQRLHTLEEFEGTGIGLAIVQRVIHRHGGRIWATGHPGRGATIAFTVPDGTHNGSTSA